jgi:hypothetical protein
VFPLALRAQIWSPKPELHQRHSAYKADALLSELFGHKKKKPPIVSEALDVCKRPRVYIHASAHADGVVGEAGVAVITMVFM